MYITCPKCNHKNDLGHLFCTKCSTKLDLSHVSEDLEDEEQSQNVRAFFQVVLLLILVIIFVLVGLAGWPSKPFAGPKNETGISGGMETQLMALNLVATRPEQSLTTYPPIEQKDFNAWLSDLRDKPKDVRSMTVLMKKDRVSFRAIRVLGPYSLSVLTTPKIPFSFEIMMKATSNKFEVASAKIGHLPMPGPAKKLVMMLIDPLFKNCAREKTIYKSMSEVKVEDGSITVTVTGK